MNNQMIGASLFPHRRIHTDTHTWPRHREPLYF